MDNKHKGNLALASAITHFITKGYTVSIPLADTAKYDLVVERDNIFSSSVQICRLREEFRYLCSTAL